jgi:hypothetical protein
MTEREREDHVNQDYKRQREIPVSQITTSELRKVSSLDWYELMEGKALFTGELFEQFDFLDPLERKFLELYYLEGKTYREISRAVRVEIVVDNVLVGAQEMSFSHVRNKIKSGIEKIKLCNSANIPI